VGTRRVDRIVRSADALPTERVVEMDGDLTFRQHADPHTDAPNWPVFIEFAERQLKVKK
jgi:hypothetical protein